MFLRPHRSLRTSHSSSSSYALDSDAAPLDSAAINRFTAPDFAAQVLAQQEAERLAKEERRQMRRERKELKRLAALAVGNDGDFEGFQGSGGRPTPYKATPSPLLRSAHDARDDDEEEEADLDGITYARSSKSANGGSHSGGRSNSDSRTSSSGPPQALPVRAGETAYLVPKSRSRSAKHSSFFHLSRFCGVNAITYLDRITLRSRPSPSSS